MTWTSSPRTMSPTKRKTRQAERPCLLTVSGSPHPESKNSRLLAACAFMLPATWVASVDLASLPLFQPQLDREPLPPTVVRWRNQWQAASAVVISTPAYLDNMPGVLKNALDWLTSSGEVSGKKVLPITFPPHAPRGEHAMQSLLWSLKALDATIPVSLPLFQQDIKFLGNGDIEESESRALLVGALDLLL